MASHPLSSHNFTGMHIDAAAELLGKPREIARNWLVDRGYRLMNDRRLRRSRPAQEVADEIHDRIQAMRPVAPCFLCGARGECNHR